MNYKKSFKLWACLKVSLSVNFQGQTEHNIIVEDREIGEKKKASTSKLAWSNYLHCQNIINFDCSAMDCSSPNTWILGEQRKTPEVKEEFSSTIFWKI